jgi:hypothetical protein
MTRFEAKPAPLKLDAEQYELLRQQVLRRDGWRCQACGTMSNLEVHHKRFRSQSGENSEENLITLCRACHSELHHPGSKSADARGKPSGKQTFGLLQRHHVRVGDIKYIGRESNKLEQVEIGMIHSTQSVYTEYPDPRHQEWDARLLPAVKNIPVAVLMKITGKSRSMLTRTKNSRSRPRARNQQLLKTILTKIGAI